MSNFPSLQNVINATQKTILRFPLETIATICGTICAILLVEDEQRDSKELLMKVIMSCLLCLVLFLSLRTRVLTRAATGRGNERRGGG